MDADVAFDEVEMRVGLEPFDGVGADVHAVDLVAPVAQQAFGQVVADEAVDPEDQHPRAALRAGRRATQARALDQAQLGGQLRAGQVQAALAALAEAQHQRVLAAGDPQRVAGQYAARLATVVAGDHLGAPDDQLLFADLAEGARVGLGHRAHQVVQLPCRPVPVEQAVRRGAPAEVAGLALVLLDFRQHAEGEQRQAVAQQGAGGLAQLAVQAQGGVLGVDGDGLLGEDRPGVGALDHAMQGHPGLRFAVDQHPVRRGASAVARQRRTVQVVGAACGAGEQLGAEQAAVVEGEQEVRRSWRMRSSHSGWFTSSGACSGMPRSAQRRATEA